MKKTILALLLVGAMHTLQAQEGVRIGVKGAFNSTWLFNNNVSDAGPSLDYESTFGGSLGAQVIFMFAETYGMSAEVLLSSHNQNYAGFLNKNEANTFKLENRISYLDIPVLFRVSSPKGPYFEIGPQASILLGAKESYSSLSNSVANPNYSDKDFKDDFNGFGLSGILGFGVDIKISEKINLNTGLRFGYTFTDATSEYSPSEGTALLLKNELSQNAVLNHTGKDDGKGGNIFDYQKSNRVWGGLNIGLQYSFK
jgi:hypothetical protein